MNIAIVGYGRMGHEVEAAALKLGHEVTARIDHAQPLDAAALNGADVAIEFTRPDVAPDVLKQLAGLGIDVASGTTGWSDDASVVQQVREAFTAAGRGLVVAPNFSLGVALFTRLVAEAARLADAVDDYDVHVHEAHHRHKIDAPSGTARQLIDTLLGGLRRKTSWSLDLSQAPLDPSVLQVAVTRSGEISGTHTIALEGPDDRIVLTHEARSRGGFARGAIEAAAWVRGRRGLFTLDEWLRERFAQ